MIQAKRYQLHISTRHPTLIALMDAMEGSYRRAGYVVSMLEKVLSTDEGKREATRLIESMSHGSAETPQEGKDSRDIVPAQALAVQRDKKGPKVFSVETMIGPVSK